MRSLICFLTVISLISPVAFAKSRRNSIGLTRKITPQRIAQKQLTDSEQSLNRALQLAASKQYQAASSSLFSLAGRKDLAAKQMQIRYILGLMLQEMKLNQTAAFQYVDVIRKKDTEYTQKSIDKLSMVADNLGDDTLLNYAVSKVVLNNFPDEQKDILNFRIGEVKNRAGLKDESIQYFSQVRPDSRYYIQARFQQGIAYLEKNQVNSAIKIYEELYAAVKDLKVTHPNRVTTLMGLARSYYQKGDWDKSIEYYRMVPRDTDAWHDALFESSWAMLRGGQFRSALSNFQSLHSAYYDNSYQAESLLLRAIIYLYICQYDEMEKVLSLYEKTYAPIKNNISSLLKDIKDPVFYFNELEKLSKARSNVKNANLLKNLKINEGVLRNISDIGEVKRAYKYYLNLVNEKRTVERMGAWSRSAVGKYALKIINNRMKNTRIHIGEIMIENLASIKNELIEFYEQASFIRYEMINGQKEQLRKKIANKNLPGAEIDDSLDHDFYVKNGYEYWPFEGEYWLDELGNYQYLGKQSCE